MAPNRFCVCDILKEMKKNFTGPIIECQPDAIFADMILPLSAIWNADAEDVPDVNILHLGLLN